MSFMKVLWLSPPSPIEGKIPNISNYRFFKYGSGDSIIYPYMTAMGVTLLRDRGFDVEFIDCPTERKSWKDITSSIQSSNVVIMEARTPIMSHIWECCLKVKSINKEAITVLFGDHPTFFAAESLEKPGVDYVLSGGDYDVGALNICLALQDGLAICNRTYNQPLIQDLDSLPIVDRELVNWRRYFEAWRHRDNFMWIMSGKGCTYKCIFCAWVKTFWENRVRLRSPVNVADEYEMLFKKYGECEILDDIDLFKTDWGVAFSKELLRRGYCNEEMLWAFQTHPNEIYGKENFELMRKAGLTTVKLGVESMNQKTLNRIRKGLTIRQTEKAIKLLKDCKIMVHANLMVGFPWETKADAENTIKMIKKLDPNQAQFSMLIPYPNTYLYKQAVENKWLTVPENDWSSYNAVKPMLKMEGLTPEEVVDLYKEHWSSFYLNWRYEAKHLLKALHSLHDLRQLYRGYKSVKQGHMRSMDE